MKKKYILLIFLIFFALSIISYKNFKITSLTTVKNNQKIETEEIIKLKELRSFDLSAFTIDDSGNGNYTWEEAAEHEWCTGNGTLNNPYIIENITINGDGYARCLSIKNSKAHFIVRNSTFYNAGSPYTSFPFIQLGSSNRDINVGFWETNDTIISNDTIIFPFPDFRQSGIFLYNVSNGKLINNNCSSNNGAGILLVNSHNNIISGNSLYKNYDGIILSTSNNNIILGNSINKNTDGIEISYSNDNIISKNNMSNNIDNGIKFILLNHNNTISQNRINNNGYTGVGIGRFNLREYKLINGTILDGTFILCYSNHNNISENTIYHNNIGILLMDYSNSTLSENIVKDNANEGIHLSSSIYCNISRNCVLNNTVGIKLSQDSDNNTITENLVVNNDFFIVVEEGCDGNIIENNYNYKIPAGIYKTETWYKNDFLIDLSINVKNITKIFFMSFNINPIETELNDELFFIDLKVNDTENLDDSKGRPINFTIKYDSNRYRNISAWCFNNSANNGEGDWEQISFTSIDDGIIVISVNQTAIFAISGFDIGFIIPIDDDKSPDKAQNNDSIIIVHILYIAILLLVFIISIAANYIYPSPESERFTELFKKKKIKKLKQIFPPAHSAKKIVEEMIDESSILQFFDELKSLEEINIEVFEDFEFAQLSENFLNKVDKTDLEGNDKKDFLEEMIALPIELRTQIIDNILKRLKQKNNLEKVSTGIF